MSIVRVGATKQYADNWDKIFGAGNGITTAKKKAAKPAKAAARKKPAKKKVAKKPARKK